MQAIIEKLLQQIATLRFEIRFEKARRFPFRVYDRAKGESIGQFPTQEAADGFLSGIRKTYIEDQSNALSSQAVFPALTDGSNL